MLDFVLGIRGRKNRILVWLESGCLFRAVVCSCDGLVGGRLSLEYEYVVFFVKGIIKFFV